MRIGELARRTGVTQRALRYYEEQGLLTPERRPSGYREYTETDERVVRRIRILLAAGLNTAQITEVLPCLADEGDLLVPTCPELVTELSRERERIGETIAGLEATQARLGAIIGDSAPSPLHDRAIIR